MNEGPLLLSPTFPPPLPMVGAGFGSFETRVRKNIMKKTVDYQASTLRYIESRIWQRDKRDRPALQPDSAYFNELLLPVGMDDQPVNAVTTKFVRASTNKQRSPIFCTSWLPDGRRLATGAASGEFTLWNGVNFNYESILQAHDGPIRSMKWSHNGEWMVTTDDRGFVKYWQSNFNNVHTFQAHSEPIRCSSFSPNDSKLATCSDDGTVRIFDFISCSEEWLLRGHGADVKCCDWHPRKSLLVSGSKDNQQPVKLWDCRSGQSISTIHAHKATVQAVSWNKNGNWLLTASRDSLIKIYDIRAMKELCVLKGHKKEVNTVAWHPIHESLFASGGSDGAILFWLVGNGKEVGGMESAHEGFIWSLSWHPLGHILCSGSNDHTSKFWCRNRPGEELKDKYNTFSNPFASEEMESSSYQLPGMGVGMKGNTTAITLPPPSSRLPNDAVSLPPPPHWQHGLPFTPRNPGDASQGNEQSGAGAINVPVLGADIIKETFSGAPSAEGESEEPIKPFGGEQQFPHPPHPPPHFLNGPVPPAVNEFEGGDYPPNKYNPRGPPRPPMGRPPPPPPPEFMGDHAGPGRHGDRPPPGFPPDMRRDPRMRDWQPPFGPRGHRDFPRYPPDDFEEHGRPFNSRFNWHRRDYPGRRPSYDEEQERWGPPYEMGGNPYSYRRPPPPPRPPQEEFREHPDPRRLGEQHPGPGEHDEQQNRAPPPPPPPHGPLHGPPHPPHVPPHGPPHPPKGPPLGLPPPAQRLPSDEFHESRGEPPLPHRGRMHDQEPGAPGRPHESFDNHPNQYNPPSRPPPPSHPPPPPHLQENRPNAGQFHEAPPHAPPSSQPLPLPPNQTQPSFSTMQQESSQQNPRDPRQNRPPTSHPPHPPHQSHSQDHMPAHQGPPPHSLPQGHPSHQGPPPSQSHPRDHPPSFPSQGHGPQDRGRPLHGNPPSSQGHPLPPQGHLPPPQSHNPPQGHPSQSHLHQDRTPLQDQPPHGQPPPGHPPPRGAPPQLLQRGTDERQGQFHDSGAPQHGFQHQQQQEPMQQNPSPVGPPPRPPFPPHVQHQLHHHQGHPPLPQPPQQRSGPPHDMQQFHESDQQPPLPENRYSDPRAPEHQHPSDPRGYRGPPPEQRYPNEQRYLPNEQQRYPPDEQGYPPRRPPPPANDQRYPPNEQGYPPNEQGYPPNEQGYPPRGPPPANKQGYPPDHMRERQPPQQQPPQQQYGTHPPPPPHPPHGHHDQFYPHDEHRFDGGQGQGPGPRYERHFPEHGSYPNDSQQAPGPGYGGEQPRGDPRYEHWAGGPPPPPPRGRPYPDQRWGNRRDSPQWSQREQHYDGDPRERRGENSWEGRDRLEAEKRDRDREERERRKPREKEPVRRVGTDNRSGGTRRKSTDSDKDNPPPKRTRKEENSDNKDTKDTKERDKGKTRQSKSKKK